MIDLVCKLIQAAQEDLREAVDRTELDAVCGEDRVELLDDVHVIRRLVQPRSHFY